MKKIVYILLFIFPLSSFCQTDSTKLNLIGKITKDGSLKLRWTCDNKTIWLEGLKNGYVLEKAKFNSSLDFADHDFKIVQEVKKWNASKWKIFDRKFKEKEKSTIKYKYAKISYDLSEAKGALEPNASFEEAMEFKEQMDLVYGYAMIASLMEWEGAKIQGVAIDTKVFAKSDIFRIRLNSKIKDLHVEPDYFVVKNAKESKYELQDIDVDEAEKSIGLSWKKNDDLFATFVAVSEDGINYKSDAEIPDIQLEVPGKKLDSLFYYVDSLVNYQEYYFKIYSQDIFGEKILVGKAKGMPRDRTAPLRPIIMGAKHIEPKLVEIIWDVSKEEGDLEGFAVARSTEPFGQYYQIHEGFIPADWRSFTDEYFDADTTNYYIVEAVDTSGNRTRSSYAYLTLTDSIPPAQPINIYGVMDSIGIVTLEMKPQKEKDFMGYRVYMANNPRTEFSVIQETYNDTILANARNPILVDTSTVESLSPFIYYKVGALDYHYNESASSAIIKVPRPDKYPPVPPLIEGYEAFEDRLEFDIVLSTSFDVKQNYVYRKKTKEDDWILLDSLGLATTSFIDSTGEANTFYLYSVKAIDHNNLESEFGNILKLKTYKLSTKLDMEINTRFFKNDMKTMINWELKEEAPITSFKILYASKDGVWKSIKKSKNQKFLIIDTEEIPIQVKVLGISRQQSYMPTICNDFLTENKKIENDEIYKKYN